MVTSLGLALLFLGSCKRASGWAQVAVLVGAGAVFILTYAVFHNVNRISDRVETEHLKTLNSSSTEKGRRNGRSGRSHGNHDDSDGNDNDDD